MALGAPTLVGPEGRVVICGVRTAFELTGRLKPANPVAACFML